QLTDTAGLRETNDFIEKEGIVRSLDQAKLSDVILLVLDISRDIETHELDVYEQLVKEYKDKIIVVANKIDCVRLSLIQDSVFYKNKNIFGSNILAVSAKDKTGLDILEKEIENKIQKLFANLDSPFLLNKRQFNLIIELIQGFDFIKSNLIENFEYEIISHHIRHMLEKILELTGRNVNEKLLDKIFKDFCIGK
ncbi:50S ribosome-binding GTPase, partial [Candidatus Dependentiae bacterium]|nr:50S ribosome-binding GTPase [Candidatus Dependentiae bacterium]